jgi:hypothetical protein
VCGVRGIGEECLWKWGEGRRWGDGEKGGDGEMGRREEMHQ